MNNITEKIKQLGYELPMPPQPVASYVSATQAGDLIFTSGMLPVKDGKLAYSGKIGGVSNTIEAGYDAAKIAVLNGLSVIHNMVGLDNVLKIIKLTGYVNSATSFIEQPKVINGASDFLVEVFGENGKHARVAIGVSELPLDASVELDLIVQVKSI